MMKWFGTFLVAACFLLWVEIYRFRTLHPRRWFWHDFRVPSVLRLGTVLDVAQKLLEAVRPRPRIGLYRFLRWHDFRVSAIRRGWHGY